MVMFANGYMNFTAIFFNFILAPILFVPSRAWRSFRCLWVLASFALMVFLFNELGLDRCWLAVERSVRTYAFYGTSHLYRYAIEAGLSWFMVAFYLVAF